MTWPNIERAHLEIAYDNGGIHRERSEGRAARELRRYLSSLPYDRDQLAAIDAWLGSLTHEQLVTVCAGDQSDALSILERAPPFTDAVLTGIFDHVC